MLHKSTDGRGSPFPEQTHPTTSVAGMPSAVKSFRTATRTSPDCTDRLTANARRLAKPVRDQFPTQILAGAVDSHIKNNRDREYYNQNNKFVLEIRSLSEHFHKGNYRPVRYVQGI